MQISNLAEAEKIIRFVETFLTLGKSHAGKKFKLKRWQKKFIRSAYAEKNGVRKFSAVYLEIPRKNGKSQLASALAVYHLIADTKNGTPEVIVAASSREQADLVFSECARMIRSSPELNAICDIQVSKIFIKTQGKKNSGGKLIKISADAGTAHGLNPTCVIVDEIHTHKSSAFWDALASAFGARPEPMLIGITTAGDSEFSLLGKLRATNLKFDHYHNGKFVDLKTPGEALYWYYGPGPGEDFDHTDYEYFKIVNPNWDVMPENTLRRDLGKMHESAIRQLRFNQWVGGVNSWLPLGAWDVLKTSSKLEPGDQIVLGLDASRSGDASALIACRVRDFFIQPLGIWERPAGAIDWTIPQDQIRDLIIKSFSEFSVLECAYDPRYLELMAHDLQNENFPMVAFPTNSPARMIPSISGFYYGITQKIISHNGDKNLSRHFENCRVKETPQGTQLQKPEDQSKKIDAAVASIIAYSRARHYATVEVEEESQPQIVWL